MILKCNRCGKPIEDEVLDIPAFLRAAVPKQETIIIPTGALYGWKLLDDGRKIHWKITTGDIDNDTTRNA